MQDESVILQSYDINDDKNNADYLKGDKREQERKRAEGSILMNCTGMEISKNKLLSIKGVRLSKDQKKAEGVYFDKIQLYISGV